MKTVSMSGSLRENVGKKDAKALRYDGQVPCVLYGGAQQLHFSMGLDAFKKIIFTPETFVIEITIDGKTYKTLLKDIQYHPVGDQVIHADFLEISDDKPVVVSLPVKLTGSSPGVLRGGKLKHKLTRLTAKGLVANMPDFVEISLSQLNIGQSIKVKNLEFDQIKFIDNANSVIVEVATARGVTLTPEEE
ncbi:MAG: 50S ribosomal protein L25/general stress protein Ctc [Bacteroidales bacterium]|nr:50S ribosomal protein L25/general stress protein Ctc [Bacteroidales bacterium]